MSKFNYRKILLTLLTAVFAVCCYFAIQTLSVHADDSSSSLTSTSQTLTTNVSYSTLSVTENSVIYLDGCTVTITDSISVADGASLTIYVGSDTSGNYMTISNGTLYGSFTVTQGTVSSTSVLTLSGSSITMDCDAYILGTISVTDYTVVSGEIYVKNAQSKLNSGYALTASALTVKGGASIMDGSNSYNDVYITTPSDGEGAFVYTGGSFYTVNGINVTPDDLVNFKLALNANNQTSDLKMFTAVSKVYVDGVDYSVSITDTNDTSKSGPNIISVYLSKYNHSISVVDGEGLWATYDLTYNSGDGNFTQGDEVSSPKVDLAAGTIYVYSQYYVQNGTKVLWGGQYNLTVSEETSNQIIVVSDNNVILSFTGGGTFTADCVISFATETKGAAAGFTLEFDDGVYNFGSGTAVSITGGSLTCETGSVTYNNLYIKDASLTLNGGAICNADDYAVYVENGAFTMSGGSIYGCGYAVYALSSDVVIEDGSIYGNSAQYGVIYVSDGTLEVNGGEIYGNTGTYAGAVYADESTLGLNGGVIAGNYCTAETGGGAVVCHNSICSVDGAFVYGNYRSVSGVVSDGDAIYGDSGSSIEIVSGIISSYEGAEQSENTVMYTVEFDSETTLSEVVFGTNTYSLTNVTMAFSSLYVYGDGDSYMLYITGTPDGGTEQTTYTYALFMNGDEGYAAKQVSSDTKTLGAGEYYLLGDYNTITVTESAIFYLDKVTQILAIDVEDGATLTIYLIDNNVVGVISGDGSVVINGNGILTVPAVSIKTFTVNSGIIDFENSEPTIIVNGGAYLNSTNVTATNADGDALELYTIDSVTDITSVEVDGTDYGVAASLTTFSLFLTKENHTVTVGISDRTYIYNLTWSQASQQFSLMSTSDGDLTYNLNGGSVIITSKGYTVEGDTDETSFEGEYVVIGSSTENSITIDGDAELKLSGVSGTSLTVKSGTAIINLVDGTVNAFTSITVESGAKLYIYCSTSGDHSCTDNCGVLSAESLAVSGTLYIVGGIIQIPQITAASGGVINVSGGEIDDSVITVAGELNISGKYTIFSDAQITVSGVLTMSDGTISGKVGTAYSPAVYLSGGTFEMTGGEIYANTAITSGGAVYVNSTAAFEMSGGYISGSLYVNGGALTINDGVVTQASGDGTVIISGGYVCGSFDSVANADGDDIYLIEITLPQSTDISKLTITIDGEKYAIGRSYTSGVLYIYGGSIDSANIECVVVYNDTDYIYSLVYSYSLSTYYLPESTQLDISTGSYVLCEDGYYLAADEDKGYKYVSYGYYVISQSTEGVCNTLYTSGSVTVQFNGVSGMAAIEVKGDGVEIYGDAQFTNGISSGGSLVIIGGTFVAAYVDSNVVIEDGSLTVSGEITKDGCVTISGGAMNAAALGGTLYVEGGYVAIEEQVPSTAKVVIDGGSVNATFAATPQNSTDNKLYLFCPDLSYIEGEIYSVLVDSVDYNISGEYTEIYLYLTAGSHVVSVESSDYYLVYNLVFSDGVFTDYDNGILDISSGSVTITTTEAEGVYTEGYIIDGEFTAYTGDYVFLQSEAETANTITVDGVSVTIYLYGVAIYSGEDYAISIINGADVTIVLPDDADNIIAATLASIYVDGTSTLTIACAHAEENDHDDCSYCGVLYADYASRLFYVEGTLNVNGGYFMGGYAEEGGAIYIDSGCVNINGGIFYGNYADYGGAAYIESGSVNIYGGYIFGNVAAYGGGIFVNSGKLYMSGGSVQYNDAYYGGGVFVNGGTFTLADGSFYLNNADYYGGGIYAEEGTTVSVYGGEMSLNTSSCGEAVYSLGTLKIYDGIITAENAVYCDEGSQTAVYGGMLSIYAYGSLKVTGGSVNVLCGEVTDGSEELYCIEISLDDLQSLEIDGVEYTWYTGSILSSATEPDTLYIWVNSSTHLIKQTMASQTLYYIAVYNGASFTLHSAQYTEVSQNYEINSYGYYYLETTVEGLTVTISADCTVFISGHGLSSLVVSGGRIASVYGLNGYEADSIAVNGVLIAGGIAAAEANIADSSSLKLSSSQIGEITLGTGSKLILGDGEIDITTVYISSDCQISVSGSPVLTGIITIEFATGSEQKSVLFADSTALNYAKYFISGDSNYNNITKESGGLRISLTEVTLTINVTGGSVIVNGAEYIDGDEVTLASGVEYSLSFAPDTNYYLSSATLGTDDVSAKTAITLTADSTLAVEYVLGTATAYKKDAASYIGAYATLEEAAASGKYVVMLGDSSAAVEIASSITLDLGGFAVTGITVASGVTLTVTGEGSLSVTNNGALVVYGGIITVNSASTGTITAYGGAFTSNSLTVVDGDGADLKAFAIALPANTYYTYVDGEDYGVSSETAATVYFYLSDSSRRVVTDSAAGYKIYSISYSGGTATELEDTTVYDISDGFITITQEGSYYIMQTGADVYGITVNTSGDVELYLESLTLQSAGYALLVKAGTVNITCYDCELAGALGGIVVEGGYVGLYGSAVADIAVSGGSVNIVGEYEGDVAASGGIVSIADTLSGDIQVNGATITISVGGTLEGSITLNSGLATITGTVDGDISVYGGTLELGGKVNGSVALYGGTVCVNELKVYGSFIVSGGEVALGGGKTLTSAAGVVIEGGSLTMGTASGIVGAITLNGGSFTADGVIDGDITVTDGTLTITSGIFYGAVTISGGATYIDGGLFVGEVTAASGAYCVISGGAFAYKISGRTLYAVTLTDTEGTYTISSLTVDNNSYSGLSITLSDVIIYLAGGYSLTINGDEVKYTAGTDSGSTTNYTIIDSTASGSITAAGNYVVDGFTGEISINIETADDIVNIYLYGGSLTYITVSSQTTVNIYAESGITVIGGIVDNSSGTATVNIIANDGILYVTGENAAYNITINSTDSTVTSTRDGTTTIDSSNSSIGSDGDYVIAEGYSDTITISTATEDDTVNIYLYGNSLASITVNTALDVAVNIYVESGVNVIGSIVDSNSIATINVYVNGGILYVTGENQADSTTINGGVVATPVSSTDNSYNITASGEYIIDSFTGTLYVDYTASGSETVDIYLAGNTLESITVLSAVTVNIYVLSGTNTIGSIIDSNGGATINIIAEGGMLTVTGENQADSTTVNGGIVATLVSSTDSGYYITASGGYIIDGFAGALYVYYTASGSEAVDIYLIGSSLDSITVASAVTVNIYVLSGTNTIGSIIKSNSGAEVNIYMNGGMLYASGAIYIRQRDNDSRRHVVQI